MKLKYEPCYCHYYLELLSYILLYTSISVMKTAVCIESACSNNKYKSSHIFTKKGINLQEVACYFFVLSIVDTPYYISFIYTTQ